jgi:8-oxo-dGTP diphosphatase
MKEYVAGFLFNKTREDVVLVHKLRPPWQAGKYNGVGGKIEAGETPHEAMQREFFEETGHQRNDWESFCSLTGDDFKVYFYWAVDEDISLHGKVFTKTDEPINIKSLLDITLNNALPNLQWLIPMALSMTHDATNHFQVTEQR